MFLPYTPRTTSVKTYAVSGVPLAISLIGVPVVLKTFIVTVLPVKLATVGSPYAESPLATTDAAIIVLMPGIETVKPPPG